MSKALRAISFALVGSAAFFLVRWSSPWFPDRDLIRWGLFVRPVPIEQALIEACNDQGGNPWINRDPCRVSCLDRGWEQTIAESVCEGLR
jgi:hypothetical protein